MDDHADVPDPDRVHDLPGFIAELARLRAWAGQPSFRRLADQVGPLMRPPRQVAYTTISDVFKADRQRLNHDLLTGIVRALGVGGADVDRWRQALIRVQARNRAADAPATGVFHQLPAELPTFTGRTALVRRLMAELVRLDDGGAAADGDGDGGREAGADDEDAAVRPHAGPDSEPPRRSAVIATIEGMAGIGKTQTAVHLAHELVRHGRYTDVQLFVNLHGFDPERPPDCAADVLSVFLRQLAVPAREIPEPTADRAAMFRDRLHGRRALVVLDDAADEEQVRHLVPAGPDCLVLVTSRRRLSGLAGAVPVVLDQYSPAESLELLGRIAGADRVAAEPDAAREIVEACGGLPLAVAVVAARLRSRPVWRLADLARRLRTDRGEVFGSGTASPWRVFEVSYTGLDDTAQRVFRLLAAHPGRGASVGSVAALAGLGTAAAEAVVRQLADEYLLQERGQGRYELHDLLRDYAGRVLGEEEDAAERAAAVGRVLRWFVAAAEAAAEAVTPGVGGGGGNGVGSGGGDGGGGGTGDGGSKSGDDGSRSTDRNGGRDGGDYVGGADCVGGDDDRSADGDGAAAVPLVPPPGFPTPADATAWLTRELPDLLAAVDVAAVSGRHAECCRLAGALHHHLRAERRHADQIRVQELALAAARAAGDRRAAAVALRLLGLAETELHRDDDGRGHLTAALDLYRALDDLPAQVDVMAHLVANLVGAGRAEDALRLGAAALALSRGLRDQRITARILVSLAMARHLLRQSEEAQEHIREAAAILRRYPDDHSLGVTLRNLGVSLLALARFPEAEDSLVEAIERFRAVGETFREIEAWYGVARARAGQGRASAARAAVAEAEALLDELEEAWAARYRQELAASPLRYPEDAAASAAGIPLGVGG